MYQHHVSVARGAAGVELGEGVVGGRRGPTSPQCHLGGHLPPLTAQDSIWSSAWLVLLAFRNKLKGFLKKTMFL